MKKIKNFMNKPMTWGGYTKLCAVSMAVGIVATVVEFYALGLDPLRIKDKFNKNEIEEDENDYEY